VPYHSFPKLSGRWHEPKSQELGCFADYRVILHAVVASLLTKDLQFGGYYVPCYSDNLAAIDIVGNELETIQHTVARVFPMCYLHFTRVAVYNDIIITRSKATVTELLPL